MNERTQRYLELLKTQRWPISSARLEALSSDAQLSIRDLAVLARKASRYADAPFLATLDDHALQKDLTQHIYYALHDKESLLDLAEALLHTYRQNKRSNLVPFLERVVMQAQALGASPEELERYIPFLRSTRRRLWLGILAGFLTLLFLIVLFVWLWHLWSSPRSLTSLPAFVHRERPVSETNKPLVYLRESKNLQARLTSAFFAEGPAPFIERALVEAFPEGHAYHLRAGVNLPFSITSFDYRITVKDSLGRVLEEREFSEEEASPGLWVKGTILPLEKIIYHQQQERGLPETMDIQVLRVQEVNRRTPQAQDLLALEVIGAPRGLQFSLRRSRWRDDFGYTIYETILEVENQGSETLGHLGVRMGVFDSIEDPKPLLSKEFTLLSPLTNLSLRPGDKRRFLQEFHFIKELHPHLLRNRKAHRLELIEWGA